MSAGPGIAGPGPAPRTVTLMALERELAHAVDVHEDGYASELRARIARLSQGSAANPAKETTAARRPARRKT